LSVEYKFSELALSHCIRSYRIAQI